MSTESAEEPTEQQPEQVEDEVILARAEDVAESPEELQARLAELAAAEAELEAPLRELEERRRRLEELREQKARAELDLARHKHAEWWEQEVDAFAAVHREAVVVWDEVVGPLTVLLERLLVDYEEKSIRARSAWSQLRHLTDVQGSPHLPQLSLQERGRLMPLPDRSQLRHLREVPLSQLLSELLVDTAIRLQRERREAGLPPFRSTVR